MWEEKSKGKNSEEICSEGIICPHNMSSFSLLKVGGRRVRRIVWEDLSGEKLSTFVKVRGD